MLKALLVDGKEELVWKNQVFWNSLQCVGCQAEPVDALDYGWELSAGFPSRHAHILSGGIAVDTSPGSFRVHFPSQPKLVGTLAKHPCGGDCEGRNLFGSHWPRHLGEVSFLCVSVRGGFVQP